MDSCILFVFVFVVIFVFVFVVIFVFVFVVNISVARLHQDLRTTVRALEFQSAFPRCQYLLYLYLYLLYLFNTM